MDDGIEFFTFQDAQMVAGSFDEGIARSNRALLQTAIAGNPGRRIVVGLPGDYYIAKIVPGDTIPLVSNSIVWCLPGCRIIRKKETFDSGKVGVISAVRDADGNPITNARWIGGTFVGEAAGGIYPEGEVFHIEGNDILIEDVTIEGFNGIAMMIAGDRVRVVNPTIRQAQTDPANGAGIRVKRGTGFRCYGGDIASGGDAAIQFSGDDQFNVGVDPKTDITDGLFQGVHCSSEEGRLILVGSTYPRIDNVRFVGITGETRHRGRASVRTWSQRYSLAA